MYYIIMTCDTTTSFLDLDPPVRIPDSMLLMSGNAQYLEEDLVVQVSPFWSYAKSLGDRIPFPACTFAAMSNVSYLQWGF